MNISQYVVEVLEKQGRSKKWLASQINVNYKTLVDRLLFDRLTAYDLIRISNVINIDLNELKLKYKGEEK